MGFSRFGKSGFCSFEKLMADKEWLSLSEHSKVACLEIKRCLPSIEKEPTKRMTRIMELASEMVDEAVFTMRRRCSMHSKPMKKVANYRSGRPWSRLLPVVPEQVRTTVRGFVLFLNSYILQSSDE